MGIADSGEKEYFPAIRDPADNKVLLEINLRRFIETRFFPPLKGVRGMFIDKLYNIPLAPFKGGIILFILDPFFLLLSKI